MELTPCPGCNLPIETDHDCTEELKERIERLEATTRSFLSDVLTIKLENQPEWMEYLAERINEVCEVICESDRVAYNPRQEAILSIKK